MLKNVKPNATKSFFTKLILIIKELKSYKLKGFLKLKSMIDYITTILHFTIIMHKKCMEIHEKSKNVY